MDYSINQLARLAGVSARTLRYYDEIHLLKPLRISSTGYRIYGSMEVNRLQQILLYKTMQVPLEQIAHLLDTDEVNPIPLLENHYQDLIQRRRQLDVLIHTLELTIQDKKGLYKMTDKEKFEGLKDRLLEENDNKYREEVIRDYGEENYQSSRKAFKNMSEEQYNHMMKLGESILKGLKEAIASNLTEESEEMKVVATQHADWVTMSWGSYKLDAHLGLVDMYLQDDRFKQYYEVSGQGAAQLLRDAVYYWLK